MKKVFLFLVSVILSFSSNAQILKGKIIDKNKLPVPYASVYIHQTQSGVQSNSEGEYAYKLPQGNYTITYRALGFIPLTQNIALKDGKTEVLNVTMTEQIFELKEIKVTADKEDPAYGIMRKAISLASYYKNYIKHYQSEIYLKGSIKIVKMPKLFSKMGSVNGKPIKSGDMFLQENLSQVNFDAPDKYVQKVISSKSSYKLDSQREIFGFLNWSFYETDGNGLVSPLSPLAMSYYNFKYEGFTKENNHIIYKIKLIPKTNSLKLLSGTIHIIDKTWNIHSVDVNTENSGIKSRIVQFYAQVKENMWLPVSSNFYQKVSIMGVEVDATFCASSKYSNIIPKDSIQIPELLANYYIQQKMIKDSVVKVKSNLSEKQQKELNELMKKENLTNRELKKVTKLMNKQFDEKKKKSLEIKDERELKVEKDAFTKDTAYWNRTRPTPLSTDEIKGYAIYDSINKNKSKNDSLKNKSFFSKILLGNTFYSKDSSSSFTYNGLINKTLINYNTVDGWALPQEFSYKTKIDSVRTLHLVTNLLYSFNRDKLYGKVSIGMNTNPLYNGYLRLSAGIMNHDYNSREGIKAFPNTIASLFFRKNIVKFYEKSFIDLFYTIEPVNGLAFSTEFSYQKRRSEVNHSDYSFFFKNERNFTPNIPVNSELTNYLGDDINAAIVQLNIRWTPMQYYRYRDGRKINLGSSYPTFRLAYKKGLKINNFSDTDFDFVEASIRHRIRLGYFSNLEYSLNAGKFMNINTVGFADFKHFNTYEFPVFLGDFSNSFVFPEYYSISTTKDFFEGHLTYKSSYILLKYLPVLNKTLIEEAIYVNYLTTSNIKNYLEVGYGLNNIYFFANLGVFCQFENGKYTKTGIKVSVNF